MVDSWRTGCFAAVAAVHWLTFVCASVDSAASAAAAAVAVAALLPFDAAV